MFPNIFDSRWQCKKHYGFGTGSYCEACVQERLEGWVPPEVVRQVLSDVSYILDAHTGYYSEEFKRELCICHAPPMQPCGPKCRYPYTDEVLENSTNTV